MTSTQKKVVILGGGIAGLSAAHELIERGFAVEVCEKRGVAGGKARSTLTRPTTRYPFTRRKGDIAVTAGGPPLPGEHGFRFFPRFYKHVIDTMGRIPHQGGSVADNLVETSQVRISRFDRPSILLPARFPRDVEDIRLTLLAVISFMSRDFELDRQEVLFFVEKLWRIVTSCEERRLLEYERINWWDFIEADARTTAYQKYFGDAATRTLVAAKARRASTKTIGDIYVQILRDLFEPGPGFDRVLNGPTNDVWIDPWIDYLITRGVVFHDHAEVRSINHDAGRVRSATVAVGPRVCEIAGDYFIAALPVERMAQLLSPALLAADPSLVNIHELTEYVEWMTGIQFYLNRDVPIAHGHTSYVDTPWALTSISQAQFWPGYDLARYDDGSVRGIISVCISNWDVEGLNGKQAKYCSRDEIATECWQQLKRSLNIDSELLRDEYVHSWALDENVTDGDPNAAGLEVNAEPLLVNYVDTWRLRPEAITRIPNLFLASDYVRTFTDLATMEAANEAARRAVNGIITAARADVEPCQLWNLHEPEAFLPLRAYDRARFRRGLPWDGEYIRLARSVLERVSPMAAHDHAPDPQADVAASARASSDIGLRQLRIG
jgi:uncharacterized protein with NAD-binding domain and iron-sulfur cluster